MDGEEPERLHAAREHAIRLLTDRYAEGVVDDAGLEARLVRLRSASDSASVEAVVADLSDMGNMAGQASLTGDARPDMYALDPGWAATRPLSPPLSGDEQRMLAVMSTTRRDGWWEVPRLLKIRAVMADVKLDLRDAHIPAGCTMDVGAYLSEVKLIVRPGTTVSFDVLPMLGEAINKAPAHGPLSHIQVSGSVFMGSVKVLVRERGR